jgi:hypothetical protein
MKPIANTLQLLMLFISLIALSCGGGGSSGSTELAGGGGIGGTGVVSSGSVTALGSIWINGTRFDTSDAEVYVDDTLQGVGDPAILKYLDPGNVVRVTGRLDSLGNGTAEAVEYSALVAGPIDAIQSIDESTKVLTALGQQIIVDERTNLKNVTAGALSVGQLVECSGFSDDTGSIQATFLFKQADAVPQDSVFRITGAVSGLDPTAQTFFINAQIIDYSQANIDTLLPSGIANGLLVSATGQLADDAVVFEAEVIDRYSRLEDADAENIEIQGIVGTAIQPESFTLEGYLVEVTPATELVGGETDDLLAGVNLEVEGSFSAGVILAEKITFNQIFRAESDLAVKNVPVQGGLLLVGLNGLTIQTNALTRFSGLAAGIEQVLVGDHLVVKGRIINDQTVTASQVIKLPAVQNKIVLRSIVTRVNDPVIAVNNVSIDTDLLPDDGFYIAEEVPVSRADFISQLLIGDWVQIRGNLLADNSVVWDTITLVQAE